MAQETQDRIYNVKVDASDSLKTLAELKLRSQELRAEQKNLGEVTEENAEKYYALDSQIKAINAEAGRYQKQITNSIKLQNQQDASLAKLRTQLALDSAEFAQLGDSMADAARKAELGERIAATTAELKRQEEALGDHRRSVGDYAKGAKNLQEELRRLTDELYKMAAAGQQGSDTYKELIARAAQLKDAQADVNAEIKGLASDTLKIDQLSGSVQGVMQAFILWQSTTKALGGDSEKLASTIKTLTLVMTALSAYTQIQNLLQKQSAVYGAASNIVQLVGINQTKAEVKALAAKNAMLGATTVASKAAAAATWLWNAALAANPVVLVVAAVAALAAGVYGLTKAFGANKEAVDTVNNSQEKLLETTRSLRMQIEAENQELELARIKTKTRSAEEIEDLRKKGSTQIEILKAQNKAEIEQLQAEEQISSRRAELYLAETRALKNELTRRKGARDLSLADVRAQFEAENEELIKQLQERERLFAEEEAKMKGYALQQITLARETGEAIGKEVLKTALARSKAYQKLREDDLKFENTGIADNIQARQKYESDLFKVQQAGEKERLKLQLQYGEITKEEYNTSLAELSRAARQFYANQTKDLNDYYKSARDSVMKLVTQTVEEQIQQVTTEYTEAMEALGKIQPPVRLAGMSDEDFNKALSEYENFMLRRAEIETRLQKDLQDKIEGIKKSAQDKALVEAEKNIGKEYAQELALAEDNQRKRLQLEAEVLKKQIEARKALGAETYEQEAQLRANAQALRQLDYNNELRAAEKNAKQTYEVKKRYIEAELAAHSDNIDRVMELERELANTEEEFWEARMSRLRDWGAKSMDVLTSINSLASALGEREKQEVESRYDSETEALQKKYDLGLISEAKYNAEKLKLEKKQEKELAKIEKQQAIRDRSIATFQTAINTAQSIMASAKIGFPAAIPFVAMAAALGAIQTAAIWAAPLPQAAKGKYIVGPSHANGGVPLEVEGGEVIINKKSASMYLPLLSAINEAGGGVPFTTPGSDGGYTIRSSSEASPNMSAEEMRDTIREAFADVNIIATIEDIRREDRKYINIESAGTF